MVHGNGCKDAEKLRNFIRVAMGELTEYDALVRRVLTVCRSVPTRAATVAVNFTKERFRQQNWFDTSADKWEERKHKAGTRTDRRHILVKSGRLMRSVRKIMANSDRAIIGSDVPYAQVHNDGGNVKAVAQVGSYRKKDYERKAHTRTRNGRKEQIAAQTIAAHTVKAHRRQVNFKMPQRQFLGTSSALTRRIEDQIDRDINQALQLR